MLNILIVWAATGIWHGASINFLIWGLYYAFLLMIEKLWLLNKLNGIKKSASVITHFYALFFIALGWGIFAIPDAKAGLGYLGALFGSSGIFVMSKDIFQLANYAFLFVILVLASLPLGKKLFYKLPFKFRNVTEVVLIMGGLMISTAYLVDSTYNPFLYFRF